MAKKIYQQTLRGAKSSNRAFRYMRLRPSQIDELRVKAARLAKLEAEAIGGVEADQLTELRRRIHVREAIKLMLVAVTKEPVPEPTLPPKVHGPPNPDGTPGKEIQPPASEPDISKAELWEPVDVGKLTLPGPYSLDELFEAPDYQHLEIVYSFNHEVNFADAENVVKKEHTVSGG